MVRATLVAALLLLIADSGQGQTFRKTLISTSRNIQVENIRVDGKDITPNGPASWSLHLKTLHGGKQEGSQLLTLDNGKLQIVLIPTRGMGILNVNMGDIQLGWNSPVKEIVHPKHMNLALRGGLGWLEGFNEWLARCGLENTGQAGPDEIVTNVGDKATIALTLHGKIANIPASEVEVFVQDRAPYRVTVRGVVHEKMLFGPKLELITEISTEPGSNKFRIHDTIVNKGTQPQEYQVLYHYNFGKPLLGEGARLYVPLERVTPYNANAARDVQTFHTFAGPKSGYVEQVYLMRPRGDEEGKVNVLFHNGKGNRAVSLKYGLKELPYLSLWKNTGADDDGYVVGIEPGSSFPNLRKVEREAGRVPQLDGGGSHTMQMDFTILDNKYWIDHAIGQINDLQKGKAAVIDAAPEK